MDEILSGKGKHATHEVFLLNMGAQKAESFENKRNSSRTWSAIQDIQLRFGKLPNKIEADKNVLLNDAFIQYLEEADNLFIPQNDGTKTLGTNPVAILQKIIINVVMECLPSKKNTETNKEHIATIFTEIRTLHWGFKKDWDAYYFDKQYLLQKLADGAATTMATCPTASAARTTNTTRNTTEEFLASEEQGPFNIQQLDNEDGIADMVGINQLLPSIKFLS
eukprot:jgi/Psemu1/26776/gm1.26776_g